MQGVTLGAGDELVAGIRSLAGTPYDQALGEERAALSRFSEHNPGTALGAELAGGFAVPGGLAARAVSRAPTFLGKATRSSGVGAGYGATAGFASGEDGFQNRIDSGMEGAGLGAAIGAGLPAAARAIGGGRQAVTSVADNEAAAQLYFADRLRKAGMTEADIARELQAGQQATRFQHGTADLPETIADVSPTTQRVLRGIKVGGDADEIVEPFLANRQAGQIDFGRGAEAGGQIARLRENMRLAMGLSDETFADKVAGVTAKRSKEADKLFAKARQSSQPFDLSTTLQQYSLRAMELTDVERRMLGNVIAQFTQEGTAGIGRYGLPRFPVTDVSKFHSAKQTLDAEIAGSKGNLRRLLTGLKHDLMRDVFKPNAKGVPTINAAYRDALDNFASKSELLNAGELGRAFANGTEQISRAQWASMSEAEKAMVRRAWLQVRSSRMGGKAAGPTTDFTGALRSPNVGDQLRFLMPQRAGETGKFAYPGGRRAQLSELTRRETRISDTARKVLGNSTTAEKAVDAIDVGSMVRSLRYIRDQGGLINAAVNSLADALEKLSAIKGERAKYLAQQLLATDPAQQAAFLARVAQEYGEAQARKVGAVSEIWREAFTGAMSATGAMEIQRPAGDPVARALVGPALMH
ncbi:hypothetical protein [Hyphomicrobium nitrativorans]|uniref:hypothetical protein n=1 Tax=Hyphomicrobium nitrativorans TaxID=1427356 RepID=UPI001183061E|nr:hypothetical protein [Hyphomicrobium nitrativorans]